VTALPLRGTYALVDHHGRPVTEQAFRGSWQLVQFGFTRCRVVCPRALGKLSRVLDEVGELPVVGLYVTVDPEHDSPEVMRAFLDTSHPRFTGLTGTVAQVEDAKAAFRVFTRARTGAELAHTAITYLLDPDATAVHHWPDVRTAEEIVDDLRRLAGDRPRAAPPPVG
jgi:protein SCO1/2